MMKKPFLCLITPIFDQGLESAKMLVRDLQNQSLGNFILVLISNGLSEKTKKYVETLRKTDKRFIYDEIPLGDQSDGIKLLVNLGKRRNYALAKYKAERYFFIDADSAIIDKNFVSELYSAQQTTKKDLILIGSKHGSRILPKFPITLGRIGIANYTFSEKFAKQYSYPEDVDTKYGWSNDYRYFLKINHNDDYYFLNILVVDKDCRRSYQTVGEFYSETVREG